MLSNSTSANNLTTPAPPSHGSISSHLHQLKNDLGSFKSTFSSWVGDRLKTLNEDRVIYHRTLEEESETIEAMQRQYNQLVAKKAHLVETLEAERREEEELTLTNTELQAQLTALTKRLDAARSTLEQLQMSHTRELNIKVQREKMEKEMQNRMEAQLCLYQHYLGLTAEPLNSDCTRFTFVNIDPADWARRFEFEVSVAKDQFEVIRCVPEVPGLIEMQNELNESRDFFGFLKAMRKAFCLLVYPLGQKVSTEDEEGDANSRYE